MNIKGEENSSWEKLQELGQGGFGNVCLYRNMTTGESIAVKKLQLREAFADVANRVWERWKQEVYIMNKLDHNNVIRAITVPPELDGGPDDIPALGMEYCEGGDLRKLLLRPENCCGLREVFIRDILSGIGSGIEYLHSRRIYHRDIKPENIVLQPTGEENRYQYKIIDLGYARELDTSNSCMLSHVGTQQYLAPELYGKQPYTRTVDYWSFGYVAYECITGKRPFLLDLHSVQWHKEISKKSPDDITAFHNEKGEVKFSKNIPGSTHLCSPLKTYLEQWLKLMLRWDSKSRGGGVKTCANGEERPKCFCVLEQILEMKLFHVTFAKANQLLSFPVNGNHTIEMVHSAIEAQHHIPVADQLLFSRNGLAIQRQQFALEFCNDSSSENTSVFLFCQGQIPENNIKKNKLPGPVESIVKEPHTVLPIQRHKEAWKNVVYYCDIENFDNKRLVKSERTAMKALLNTLPTLVKQKDNLNDEMNSLLAFKEFFKMSLEFDLQQLNTSDKMYFDWVQSAQESENIDELTLKRDHLCFNAQTLMQTVFDLEKKATNSNKDVSKLEECEKEAKKLYDKLRSFRVDQKNLEHSEMVDIVVRCVVSREDLTKNINSSIDQVIKIYQCLKSVQQDIESLNSTIQITKQSLMDMQRKRQEDIWKLSTNMINLHSPNLTADSSMNLASMWNGNLSFMQSLSTPMESIRLVDDSKTSAQQLDDILETMERDHNESMKYFSAVDS